jgi:hypothetical protein
MSVYMDFSLWDLFAIFIILSFITLFLIYTFIIVMMYLLRDKIKLFINIALKNYNRKIKKK